MRPPPGGPPPPGWWPGAPPPHWRGGPPPPHWAGGPPAPFAAGPLYPGTAAEGYGGRGGAAPPPRYVGGVAGTPWAAATAPDGRVYYVNRADGTTAWSLPPEVAAAAAAAGGLRPPPPPAATAPAAATPADAPPKPKKKGGAQPLTAEQVAMVARVAAVGGVDRLRPDLRKLVEGVGGGDAAPPPSSPPDIDDDDLVFDPAEVAAAAAAGKVAAEVNAAAGAAAETSRAADQPERSTSTDPLAAFYDMLREAKVSPYAPWSKVERTLGSDPRWKAVGGTTARRDAFDAFCAQQAAAETSETQAKETTTPAPTTTQSNKRDRAARAAEKLAAEAAARGAAAQREAERRAAAATRAADEAAFITLLGERVKASDAGWDAWDGVLAGDPLKRGAALPASVRAALFARHVATLTSTSARDYADAMVEALRPVAREREEGGAAPAPLVDFAAADALVPPAARRRLSTPDRETAWRRVAADALAGGLEARGEDAAYDRAYLEVDRKRVRRG